MELNRGIVLITYIIHWTENLGGPDEKAPRAVVWRARVYSIAIPHLIFEKQKIICRDAELAA